MGAGIREEQQQIRAASGAVSGPKGGVRRREAGQAVQRGAVGRCAIFLALPDVIGQSRRALAQNGSQIAGQGGGKFRGAGRLAGFLCEDFSLRMHVA